VVARRKEKGKKKKEKGIRERWPVSGGTAPERELSVGCPGKNYELEPEIGMLSLTP